MHQLEDSVFDDARFQTALTHRRDPIQPAVSWIAGFEAWLDHEIAIAVPGGAAAEVDAGAVKALIRATVALNTSGGKARPRRAK